MYFEIHYEVKGTPAPPKEGRWQMLIPVPRNPQEGGEAIKKLLARNDWVVITIRKIDEEP